MACIWFRIDRCVELLGYFVCEENYPGRKAVLKMAKTIAHRGPDGEGFFFDCGDRNRMDGFSGEMSNPLSLGKGKGALGWHSDIGDWQYWISQKEATNP